MDFFLCLCTFSTSKELILIHRSDYSKELQTFRGLRRKSNIARLRTATIVQLIVGAAIVLWLLQIADLCDTFSAILQINVLYLLAAASLFVVSSTLVGLALYVSLKQNDPAVPVGKVVMASFGGQLLSDVTPARSGYFLTPILASRLANVSIDKGMAGVFATGAINALVKGAVCLIGLAYFISFLPLPPSVINSLIVGVAILLFAGAFLLLLMWEKRMSKAVTKIEGLPLIGKKLHKITEMFANIQQQSGKVKRSFGVVALLILASLFVNAAALYCVFFGLWISPALSLLDFFLLASFASALTYVPITIAGLGVQEIGYVLLLQLLLGLSLTAIDPKLLAFAFITRILFTGTDIIGLGPLIKVGFRPESESKPK